MSESPLGNEPTIELLEISDVDEISKDEMLWHWETLEEEQGSGLVTFPAMVDPIFFVEPDLACESYDIEAPGQFRWKASLWSMVALRFKADTQIFAARLAVAATALSEALAVMKKEALWWVALPEKAFQATISAPSDFVHWFHARPWDYLLSVRRGFLFGAIVGFACAGSSIWAISAIPYLTGHPLDTSVVPSAHIPFPRGKVPNQLAWFFIQYPYVSGQAQIRAKNFHTYVVSDSKRKREYVVTLGQKFRRVEIYGKDANEGLQVQIFTPGFKKEVWMKESRVMGENKGPDGNLWMWKTPLWNDTHFKIYALADRWLNSPYKRYSCAGFVHKFLMDAGIRVPILDAWDLAKQPWVRVTRAEMEPGDIITIRAANAAHRRMWGHAITHVGVYIGHGKLIHAATSTKASRAWIRIADLETFEKRIDKILRPPNLL